MTQPDEFDQQMDRLGNEMEKSVGKAFTRLEKGANVLSKVQQGCTLVFFNLFLCAFFGWGVYAASNAIQSERNGETAAGNVVELKELNDPELGRRYTSIIEYQVDGRTYTAEVGEPSIPAEHEVGETITVRYLRDDPQSAEVDSWVDRWLFPLLIIPAMLITAVILNFIVLRAWRRGEDADILDSD